MDFCYTFLAKKSELSHICFGKFDPQRHSHPESSVQYYFIRDILRSPYNFYYYFFEVLIDFHFFLNFSSAKYFVNSKTL